MVFKPEIRNQLNKLDFEKTSVRNFFLKWASVDPDIFKEPVKEKTPEDSYRTATEVDRGPNYLYNHTKLKPIASRQFTRQQIVDGCTTYNQNIEMAIYPDRTKVSNVENE